MYPLEAQALRTTRSLINRAEAQRAQHATALEAAHAAVRASKDRISRLEMKYDQLPGVRR